MKAILIDKNDFEAFLALENGSIITVPLNKLNSLNIGFSLNNHSTNFNPITASDNNDANKLTYF